MAGIKNFNPETVLDKALGLFWQRGYEGVSISDLEAATELNRSSLYNAFGGKDQIYTLVLCRYSAMVLEKTLPELEQEKLADGVKAFLLAYDAFLNECSPAGGCMIGLATYDTGVAAKAASECLKHHSQMMRGAIHARFRRAVETGELKSADEMRTLIPLTLATVAGLSAQSRMGAPKDERLGMIDALISVMTSRL